MKYFYRLNEKPLIKGDIFNTAITAATDIFSSDLSPSYASSIYGTYFRIYCTFDTAGVLTVRRTKERATVSEELNSGANLNANAAYVFDIIVNESETIQLRYSVNATALKLILEEIAAGI